MPVITVAGEVDLSTADLVWNEVHAQLAARPGVLVLDLSKVDFIGSAGLHVLIHSHTEATGNGTRLALVAPEQSFTAWVFAAAGVNQMFDLHRDLSSALPAPADPPAGATPIPSATS
ncbi:STAS domain-containing protein [Lentzea guizhouensis]|uniref:STAS domain-containing protein n=1 Tax=Lentzea guizhouensis TaxID=1586287 RepID=UPI001C54F9F2|nr:STAS domain-containing protein [Lentzea guizhouensis]